MEQELDTAWASARSNFETFEKAHDDYLHKLSDLTKQQEACLKAIKQQKNLINGIQDSLTRATSGSDTLEKEKVDEVRKWLADSRSRLKEMQSELPVQDNGFYLSLILGSNLNLSLLTSDQRYKYKQEYESFKWKVTLTVVFWVILAYLSPWRVIDSLGLFLLVWYYCTLTIRESILTINGSKIKGWWVLHHYFSTVLCGIVLIWKDGVCYQSFRSQFLLHVAYICCVQILQSQYQAGCLRRLHSLGQGHQMDITVEGFTGFMFKGLTFLLPFLMIGYFFQLYNAYVLWYLSYSCEGEWNVTALCYLFLFLASGNIFTTSLVIFKKFRQSGSYAQLRDLTRKYRMRRRSKKE